VDPSSHTRTAPPRDGSLAAARLRWVDVAKGLTMVLVVLAHVLGKHYFDLTWTIEVPARGAWREISDAFLPLRMPLFFTLSGLLAASSLGRARRTALARRVLNPYLLYVLWFAINAVVLVTFDFTQPEALDATPTGLLRNLVLPHTTLWYMFALAAFFLVALLLRPLGIVAVLAGATGLSVAVSAGWIVLPAGAGMTPSILRYFFVFLIGAYAPDLVRRVARIGERVPLAATLLAYAVLAVAFRLGLPLLPGLLPFVVVVGAGLGIMASVRLTGIPGLTPLLEGIGRRTLPIFVLHVPALAVLHWVATGPGEGVWAPLLRSDAVALVYPVLSLALVLLSCLAVETLLRRAGLGWLFALPIGKPASAAAPAAAQPAAAPAAAPSSNGAAPRADHDADHDADRDPSRHGLPPVGVPRP
jgi:uncharacterized membrane protein YcfT